MICLCLLFLLVVFNNVHDFSDTLLMSSKQWATHSWVEAGQNNNKMFSPSFENPCFQTNCTWRHQKRWPPRQNQSYRSSTQWTAVRRHHLVKTWIWSTCATKSNTWWHAWFFQKDFQAKKFTHKSASIATIFTHNKTMCMHYYQKFGPFLTNV